ncbi:hypothetical protein, partial [Candidatus Macondimonas diazotrophica]|uniref:hypothetical protein n=1 Tax=Candidatus Macondimonas diazotrophica TaxID=2305248 RepID=UPI00196AE289
MGANNIRLSAYIVSHAFGGLGREQLCCGIHGLLSGFFNGFRHDNDITIKPLSKGTGPPSIEVHHSPPSIN